METKRVGMYAAFSDSECVGTLPCWLTRWLKI